MGDDGKMGARVVDQAQFDCSAAVCNSRCNFHAAPTNHRSAVDGHNAVAHPDASQLNVLMKKRMREREIVCKREKGERVKK